MAVHRLSCFLFLCEAAVSLAVEGCVNPMSLLQSKLSLHQDISASGEAELMPLARSLTTEDPEAAAEHVVRYLGGQRVKTNSTSACVQTAGVKLSSANGAEDDYTIYFVKDTRKWAGRLQRGTFENMSDEAFHNTMASGKAKAWEAWMDFSDGLNLDCAAKEVLNVTRIREDGLPVVLFEDTTGIRVKIPGSTWCPQMHGYWTREELSNLSAEEQSWRNRQTEEDSYCRHDEWTDLAKPPAIWIKAVYAVEPSKLIAAHTFANAALGLIPTPPPFPFPKVDKCLGAAWSQFPLAARSFQLHLVASSPPFPDAGITQFHNYNEEVRNLEAGCFDHYLYNSLILWATSLDPFVRNLQHLETPFLALKLDDQIFSLVFSFPMSPGIVIDIRSSRLSAVEPKIFDPCERTQCN